MIPKIIDKSASVILLFLLALTAPWWLFIIVAVVVLFAFSTYWPVIYAGLIIDILYSPHGSFINSVRFTLLAIILAVLAYFLKKRLIFY